ncbi:MAG: glycoside hydrolase family 65 protein [Chloroflexota bacterium]
MSISREPLSPTAPVGLELNAWNIVDRSYDPLLERVIESIFAVSNGFVGTQASLPEGSPESNAATFVAGVYSTGAAPSAVRELALLPDWLALSVVVEGQALGLNSGMVLDHRRWLDMEHAQVHRLWRHRDPAGRITKLHVQHAASLADRAVMLQRIEITPENYSGNLVVELLVRALSDQIVHTVEARDGARVTAVPATSGVRVFYALATSLSPEQDGVQVQPVVTSWSAGDQWKWLAEMGCTYRLEKITTIQVAVDDELETSESTPGIAALVPRADELWSQHEQAWRFRWEQADVTINGPIVDQAALRFAAYHLIVAAAPGNHRVSIGARGLTGEAYRGHVFWDTEMYLLPFYTLTQPIAARSLLMYRYRTLHAARAKARALGFRGALYAWEAADTGEETTPNEVIGFNGQIEPIWTGRLAHHISADIAFAVLRYWWITGDEQFMLEAGAEIIIETARFWASRATRESDGFCHIRDVIGPDEYHEHVDDNAYTNGLAQWNLRQAVLMVERLQQKWPDAFGGLCEVLAFREAELRQWSEVADGLLIRRDPLTHVIEQFEGFHALDEIDLASYEPRVVPMDVLLGRERTRAAKVIKQPDVLMLLYLFPELFGPSVLEANFHYYDPLTGHGSSLSPGIHAAISARLGLHESAYAYFQQAAAIDLDDRMGNAAGGVHMAAQGSIWQAAVMGFGGVQPTVNALQVHPRLPDVWVTLCFPLQWRGRSLRFVVDHERECLSITLESGAPLSVSDLAAVDRLLREGDTVTLAVTDSPCEIREP